MTGQSSTYWIYIHLKLKSSTFVETFVRWLQSDIWTSDSYHVCTNYLNRLDICLDPCSKKLTFACNVALDIVSINWILSNWGASRRLDTLRRHLRLDAINYNSDVYIQPQINVFDLCEPWMIMFKIVYLTDVGQTVRNILYNHHKYYQWFKSIIIIISLIMNYISYFTCLNKK